MPLDLKGVVTEVLGPKCNERSGTLTLAGLFPHSRASARLNIQGRRYRIAWQSQWGNRYPAAD
jgi:hypothetical protein